MPRHDDPKRKWVENPLPLAGLYPCLTMQCNATYHSVSDSLKWVMTLREPSEHVEIARWSGDLQEFGRGMHNLQLDLSAMWQDLGVLRRTEVNRPGGVLRT